MIIQWPEGLNESLFLEQYWQQKPLLIQGAFNNFTNPIDPDELAGLSCEEDANSRYIEHTGNNEWRLCTGPMTDDFFNDVTGHEWSLLVSDVEKLLPEFRQYLAPFRFLPDWRIDDLMISYAPVGGSVGAHVDQYDVFLLQADGIREWQIENTQRKGVQASVSNTIAILGDFEADATWQLQPGDMLYLPPQYAHHGIAIEEPCMTWSIGFRAPSVDEILPELVNYLLETEDAEQRFTDPKRLLTNTPGLINKDDLSSLRSMLRGALEKDDDTLNQWIGRFVTEPKELQEPIDETTEAAPSVEFILGELKAGATLDYNSQKRVAYTNLNGDHTLYADGKAYECSESLAQALGNNRTVELDDLQQGNNNDLQLLATLFQLQLLSFESYD